jgi:hypothetical protein
MGNDQIESRCLDLNLQYSVTVPVFGIGSIGTGIGTGIHLVSINYCKRKKGFFQT